VLEISYKLPDTPDQIPTRIQQAFSMIS
jgi:hypothetical protein